MLIGMRQFETWGLPIRKETSNVKMIRRGMVNYFLSGLFFSVLILCADFFLREGALYLA